MPVRTTVHSDLLSTLLQRWITNRRHSEICDTFATLLDELCHDVETEAKLQWLQGEKFHNKTTKTEDDDNKANGEADSAETFSM